MNKSYQVIDHYYDVVVCELDSLSRFIRFEKHVWTDHTPFDVFQSNDHAKNV